MDQTKKRKIEEQPGGVDEPRSEEQIMSWLRVMTRDDALKFIASSAAKYSAVFDDLQDTLGADPEMRKLFVRGLAYETTAETLRGHFEQFGEVTELHLVADKHSGRSKGFAFITFKTLLVAQSVLAAGPQLIDSREVHTHFASEKNDRPGRGGGGGGFGGGSNGAGRPPVDAHGNEECTLFVRGLSYNTTDDSLRAVFQQYGTLKECVVTRDKETGQSRGFGFVTYDAPQSAQAALAERRKDIDGRMTQCNYASERARPRGPPGGPGGRGGGPRGGGPGGHPGAGGPAMGMGGGGAYPGQGGIVPGANLLGSAAGVNALSSLQQLQIQQLSAQNAQLMAAMQGTMANAVPGAGGFQQPGVVYGGGAAAVGAAGGYGGAPAVGGADQYAQGGGGQYGGAAPRGGRGGHGGRGGGGRGGRHHGDDIRSGGGGATGGYGGGAAQGGYAAGGYDQGY